MSRRAPSWTSTSSALVAYVRCTDSDGDPSDEGFSILLIGNDALAGRFAFTLADQPAATAPYTPAAATT